MGKKKLRVGVLFGGQSGEHEVSLVSARSVMKALDKKKYTIVAIGITKDGRWISGGSAMKMLVKGGTISINALNVKADPATLKLDVIFPVLHGPYGEDGTVQGMLELAHVPYVGCGVLASSVCMDKLIAKKIFSENGIPTPPYMGFTRGEWKKNSRKITAAVKKEIGFPCFVKPSNLGSSVGISKVKDEKHLRSAINFAARFDRRIIVEKAINCRELEVSVLGNDDPIASVAGEIIPCNEFYDYNAKYVDGKSMTEIPARITKSQMNTVRSLAIATFKAVDGAGLGRG